MQGHCLCGAVAFDVLAPSLTLYRCHCSLCRRQSGATSNCATLVRSERFRWLHGEALVHSWVKDTGFRSDFCSVCGSPVPNPLPKLGAHWIPAGALQADAPVKARIDLCLASRADWEPVTPLEHAYDELPPWRELKRLLDLE